MLRKCLVGFAIELLNDKTVFSLPQSAGLQSSVRALSIYFLIKYLIFLIQHISQRPIKTVISLCRSALHIQLHTGIFNACTT